MDTSKSVLPYAPPEAGYGATFTVRKNIQVLNVCAQTLETEQFL